MPILFERNDITKMHTDAIVIPANEELVQGSGTSRGIYQAAGEEALEAACRNIGHCDMGQAVITSGFALPAKYIIHAVCPKWYDGECNEQELLYSAYAKALQLAAKYKVKSIAFPLLSAGNYRYPRSEALIVANHAITDFLSDNDMDVYIVFYDSESVKTGKKLLHVDEQIDDEYVESKNESYISEKLSGMSIEEMIAYAKEQKERHEKGRLWQKNLDLSKLAVEKSKQGKQVSQETLDELLKKVDSPFSSKLKLFAERSGRSNSDIYKASNVKKKQYYKLLADPFITPKKTTVLGLAVGLRLNITETKELLASAGYALSPSSGADIIVEHFIRNKIYDCGQINICLYDNGFGDAQLGAALRGK